MSVLAANALLSKHISVANHHRKHTVREKAEEQNQRPGKHTLFEVHGLKPTSIMLHDTHRKPIFVTDPSTLRLSVHASSCRPHIFLCSSNLPILTYDRAKQSKNELLRWTFLKSRTWTPDSSLLYVQNMPWLLQLCSSAPVRCLLHCTPVLSLLYDTRRAAAAAAAEKPRIGNSFFQGGKSTSLAVCRFDAPP